MWATPITPRAGSAGAVGARTRSSVCIAPSLRHTELRPIHFRSMTSVVKPPTPAQSGLVAEQVIYLT
ncbi:hypothetical protein EVAR_55017_1 [Eumeta japonica]|uniref:Uncharacterized protein n=1 Tax=Eumeta variegata TaxID=151549 RepID=A0A4C1YAA3_EUMVA|nr:hypothetical protein EVAR_55017_1 [Eumeta japonica]